MNNSEPGCPNAFSRDELPPESDTVCLTIAPLPPPAFAEEFYFGAWRPDGPLEVRVDNRAGLALSVLRLGNGFLVGTRSPLCPDTRSLVHPAAPERTPLDPAVSAVAFRGYVLDPPIHSYSDEEDIVRYWQSPRSTHNGVFSAVRFLGGQHGVEIISDPLGIAAIYYRSSGPLVLFSTSPRLLRMPGDAMDLVGAASYIVAGFVIGDSSLTQGVKRVPAGHIVRFDSKGGATPKQWFSFDGFYRDPIPMTDRHIQEAEGSFQESMRRCMRLSNLYPVVPLSSGYDSRRIIASVHGGGFACSTFTVRTLMKQHRDLDARFAAEMARDLGFDNTVLELPEPSEFSRLDALRRRLCDSEFTEHNWILPLMLSLPKRSCMLLDGLAGDVVCRAGFGEPELLRAGANGDVNRLLSHALPDLLAGIANPRLWPDIDKLRQSFAQTVAMVPEGMNFSEFFFLMLRVRRGTGASSQFLLPAGNVAVYPYLDLDHMKIVMRHDPVEKLQNCLQSQCLEKYWPNYYRYPGTRRIPEDIPPGSPLTLQLLRQACFDRICGEMQSEWHTAIPKSWLAAGGKLRVALSRLTGRMRRSNIWWIKPMVDLSARLKAPDCISLCRTRELDSPI